MSVQFWGNQASQAPSASPGMPGLSALMGNAQPKPGGQQPPGLAGLSNWGPAMSNLPGQMPGAGLPGGGAMPRPGMAQPQPSMGMGQPQQPQQASPMGMAQRPNGMLSMPGGGSMMMGPGGALGNKPVPQAGGPPQLGALAANAKPNPSPTQSPMGQSPQQGSQSMQAQPQGQGGQSPSSLGALGANAQPKPGGYAPGQGPGALTGPQIWSGGQNVDRDTLTPSAPQGEAAQMGSNGQPNWQNWGWANAGDQNGLQASQNWNVQNAGAIQQLSPQMQQMIGQRPGQGGFQMPSGGNMGGMQGGPGLSALSQNATMQNQQQTPFAR